MVLVNTSRGPVSADFHSVPTVHLTKDAARDLRALAAPPPRGPRLALRPAGVQRTPERLVAWTSSGDPTARLPQARPRRPRPSACSAPYRPASAGRRWDLGSGTSVAAARTSGIAAALLSRHDWSAAEVRSALATTAGSVAGNPSLLRLGAGRTRARAADRPGLAFRVPAADYRAWLDGDLDAAALNTPSLLLHGDATVTRTRDQRRHPGDVLLLLRHAVSAGTR